MSTARSYKARQDVVVAGKTYAEGKTFEADPDAVRVAEALGLIERTKAKRHAKEVGR